MIKPNSLFFDFNKVLPGGIKEEVLILMDSLHHTDVVIKIQVNCLVKEFDNLDEYVYSIRRPSEDNNYDYNDQFLMILKSNSVSYY